MTKDEALSELRQIREQLDKLEEPVFRYLELVEEDKLEARVFRYPKLAEDSLLRKLIDATPIDQVTLCETLFAIMNAVSHMASHIEYLLRKEGQ